MMNNMIKNKIYKLNNRGFSLVEILVSIVLLALLATFVAAFMRYWYNMRALSNLMTEALNVAQKEMEKKYDDYSVKINNNDVSGFDPEEVTAFDCNIFGKSVKVYAVKEEFNMSNLESADMYYDKYQVGDEVSDYKFDNGYITLVRGIAYSNVVKKPIPKIGSVTIDTDYGDFDAVYFVGENAKASVKNIEMLDSSNLYKYLYQWYEAFDRYHVLPLKGETMVGEGSVVPNCPYDFNFINGANDTTLSNLARYKGKIIACLVTPGSSHGYMGNSVTSNYIYISPLPTLETASYFALYDASLISQKDGIMIDPNSYNVILTNPLNNELKDFGGKDVKLNHSGSVYLMTAGQNTAETKLENDDENPDEESDEQYEQYMTRCLEYTGTSYSTTDSFYFSNRTQITVFAVVKPNPPDDVDDRKYLTIENGSVFGERDLLKTVLDENNNNGGWQIQYKSTEVRGLIKFKLGGADVNIAELIIIQSPTGKDVSSDENKILNYLRLKYCIID